MADGINIAKTYGEVTQNYLKSSLEYQYRGKGLKFSEDLLITLESDFKKKAKNLDWLFRGKTRVHLTPTPDRIFSAIKKNEMARDFILIAEALGYGITAEQFVNGYIIIDKQPVKLQKAKSIMFSKDTVANASKLPKILFERYTTQKLKQTPNKYKPELGQLPDKNIGNVNDLFVLNDGLVVSVYPKSSIDLGWRHTSDFNTDEIIQQMNSTEVILSIDINDYITCSEGSFSSCMSMNTGSYHLGWMLHYRSDFSVMTFTHRKGDSLHKTGRSWTFVKLTEDGLPFSRPFYKLSRLYGALNDSHVNIVDDYIQKQAKDILGMSNPKKYTDSNSAHYGSMKHLVSPNMKNTHGGTSGTGYFDWDSDSRTTSWERVPLWEYKGEFPVIPFDAPNYSKGPICLLNFPDALDVNGAPTNEGAFKNEPQHNISMFSGWPERYKQFVTCKATGKRILLRDALELNDGTFINKQLAANIISGSPVKEEVVAEVEEVVVKPEIVISDVDVADF